jgi:hypothetical protein
VSVCLCVYIYVQYKGWVADVAHDVLQDAGLQVQVGHGRGVRVYLRPEFIYQQALSTGNGVDWDDDTWILSVKRQIAKPQCTR